VTGDPNAAIDRAQPLVMGPQFGGFGGAPAELSVAFVAQATHDEGRDRLPTRRRRVPVRQTRGLTLGDMDRHRPSADVRVASDGTVRLEGEHIWCPPAESIPLSRLYFL
jgi:urease subunit alpha